MIWQACHHLDDRRQAVHLHLLHHGHRLLLIAPIGQDGDHLAAVPPPDRDDTDNKEVFVHSESKAEVEAGDGQPGEGLACFPGRRRGEVNREDHFLFRCTPTQQSEPGVEIYSSKVTGFNCKWGFSVNFLDGKNRKGPVEKSKNSVSQNCGVLKPAKWTDRPVSLSSEFVFFNNWVEYSDIRGQCWKFQMKCPPAAILCDRIAGARRRGLESFLEQA